MKARIILFYFLFSTFCFSQKQDDFYKTDIDLGNGTKLTTFLLFKTENNRFQITSPKNADTRLFGLKARFARLLGKSAKNGVFITICGQQYKDSLIGEVQTIIMPGLKFKGTIINNQLSGIFTNKESKTFGSVLGNLSSEKRFYFNSTYPLFLNTITNNIYSKRVLQTKEWKNFEEKTEKLFEQANDDIELFLGISVFAQNLPFSHLSLYMSENIEKDDVQKENENKSDEKDIVFEEKNLNTAYLQIKNFSDTAKQLKEIMPKIVASEKYKNLIVDLRNNGGGGIEAAFEFAKYINNKDVNVGFFLTNKLEYNGFQHDLFEMLPELKPETTDEFINELKQIKGAKLVFKKNDIAIFSGKIYILTNSNTASTCEPIVYEMKKNQRAIIVGEKTAGKMLAATNFNLTGKYNIFLPIADFYTYDGERLDQVGVVPNIEVKSEDALAKALELINNAK